MEKEQTENDWIPKTKKCKESIKNCECFLDKIKGDKTGGESAEYCVLR